MYPYQKHLTTFTQYMDCKTRGNKTLDSLYANWKCAYSSQVLPPLGRSDPNLIHLLSTCQPLSAASHHQDYYLVVQRSRGCPAVLFTVFKLGCVS